MLREVRGPRPQRTTFAVEHEHGGFAAPGALLLLTDVERHRCGHCVLLVVVASAWDGGGRLRVAASRMQPCTSLACARRSARAVSSSYFYALASICRRFACRGMCPLPPVLDARLCSPAVPDHLPPCSSRPLERGRGEEVARRRAALIVAVRLVYVAGPTRALCSVAPPSSLFSLSFCASMPLPVTSLCCRPL